MIRIGGRCLRAGFTRSDLRPRAILLYVAAICGSGIHRVEEVVVGLAVFQLIQQELHGVDGAHRVEDPAQDPHIFTATAWIYPPARLFPCGCPTS